MSTQNSPGIKMESRECNGSGSNEFCQCCCSTTSLKYMTETFIHEDQYEIYSDMLYSCYSIKVLEINESIPMICESCISKLRDAYTFRLQVEMTQGKFKDNIQENNIHDGYIENKLLIIDVKEEDANDYRLDDIFDDSSDDIIDIEKLKEMQDLKEESNDESDINYNIASNKKNLRSEQKVKTRRKKLKKHSTSKSKENEYTCKTCNESFDAKRSLGRHMKKHPQLFICHVCGRVSPTKKLLLSHVLSHNNEKVQCDICNKLLKKGSMLRHVQKHSGNVYNYPCKLCPDKFPSYNTRLYHLAVSHGMSEKKYACKICDKSFRFSGGLSTHVKRCHLQEKKCICIECGKSLFSKNELLNHMLKHTKLRTFQCEICLKSYGRKSTLQSHMKIHNNIKAYKCEVCHKEFTQKCTLTCHMKVHDKTNALQILQEK